MRRLMILLVLVFVALIPATSWAQSPPLTTDPAALVLTGTLDNGPLVASLRLSAGADLSNVQLFVSDLTDATGDGRTRDPLPASTVTLLPAARFDSLSAGTLTQIVVQVAPPAAAGTYSGTLTIRWDEPAAGQLVVPLTVVVRTRPVLLLQNPAQVTISGRKGEQVSRQFVLRETAGGSPLTSLHALPQDLPTAEGRSVLRAERIRVVLPAQQIPGGDLLAGTLEIDLKGVQAGAYGGQVLFTAAGGNLLSLPVTVNVRNGAALPIVLLVFGVALGLGLSAYQMLGKPRDELVLRIVAIRQAMKDDKDLQDSFGSRLDQILDEAEAATRQSDWEKAKGAVGRAEVAVRRWRGARQTWISQLAYLREKLLPRLEGEAWTLRKLRQQAEDTRDNAADLETPAALRDQLFIIENALARFEALSKRLEDIGKTRTTAPVTEEIKEEWRLQEMDLSQRLETLLPEDEPGWQKLEGEVQTLVHTMLEQIKSTPQAKGEVRGIAEGIARLGRAIETIVPVGLSLPQAEPITVKAGRTARWRLIAFNLTVYALGGLILAVLGFGTLYLAKPTFGTEPVTDYLSLLIWGLGGQTTITGVADLLRGWGLPQRKTPGS